MSEPFLEPRSTAAPALALLELRSVPPGFECADRVVKAAPVELLVCEPVTPGKFLVLFAGEVDSVISSLRSGTEGARDDLVGSMFLPHAHSSLLDALRGTRSEVESEAVGVLEMDWVAPLLESADRMAKHAMVDLLKVRVAMRLGGRAFCTVGGPLDQVQAAMAEALSRTSLGNSQRRHVILSRPHADLAPFLR